MRTAVDQEIQNALRGVLGQQDNQKLKGKSMRYPIGTVATLTVGIKKYFCMAYSRMGNNLQAQSSLGELSKSLEMLWDEIISKGQHDKVAIAVLGSDCARLANIVSPSNLIKLIVSSFILASRQKAITQELVVVIHPSKLEKVNMIELNEFLQNF